MPFLHGLVGDFGDSVDCYHNGEVIAVDGTRNHPIEPLAVGVGTTADYDEEIVCLLKLAKEVGLDVFVDKVVMTRHVVNTVDIDEVETVGITFLPLSHLVKQTYVTVGGITYGITVKCNESLVAIHGL